MGKGGGCASSKSAQDVAPEAVPKPAQAPAPTSATAAAPVAAQAGGVSAAGTPATKQLKVWVIYYSMYGHTETLARKVAEGINAQPDCSAELYQVPEILPEDVLEKMHAPAKSDVPVVDPKMLPEADAFVFGFPTRFGMMCSQMKSFFDATGSLWQAGALLGKPATCFTSTGTQGGGQETTLLTAATQLAHHGMIYVPVGYSQGGPQFDVSAVKGGSPWGAGCLAGADGSRQPSEVELSFAKHQGAHFAPLAKKLTA